MEASSGTMSFSLWLLNFSQPPPPLPLGTQMSSETIYRAVMRLKGVARWERARESAVSTR